MNLNRVAASEPSRTVPECGKAVGCARKRAKKKKKKQKEHKAHSNSRSVKGAFKGACRKVGLSQWSIYYSLAE